MLHKFINENRDAILRRCSTKILKRLSPTPTEQEIIHGLPAFLDEILSQLETLLQEPTKQNDLLARSARRADELFRSGVCVSQVIHDYAAICESITELAAESTTEIKAIEFHTLNSCLDEAITSAVVEFTERRSMEEKHKHREHIGFLAHELRNSLSSLLLSFNLIKEKRVELPPGLGRVMEKSILRLRYLIDHSLAEVRLHSEFELTRGHLKLIDLIGEAEACIIGDAGPRQVKVSLDLDSKIEIYADWQLMISAVSNLIQNAVKYTHPGGRVIVRAYEIKDNRVVIEIEDQCGGLPPGRAQKFFDSFVKEAGRRSGLGLGLSISRRIIQAHDGTIEVRNLPGTGCIFSIVVPRDGAFSLESQNITQKKGMGE